MSWTITIPDALNETFIATDQDYVRNILIAHIRTFLLEHQDAGPFRDYVKEEERNLYISGIYKQDIRFMPQVTIDAQATEIKPMAIGDIGSSTRETITVVHSQNMNVKIGVYALALDENRLIQSILGYGFTNKWFRFSLYKYGLYVLDNTLSLETVTTTAYQPEKMLYRSGISVRIWTQIQQDVKRKTGVEIQDVVPSPNWDP